MQILWWRERKRVWN